MSTLRSIIEKLSDDPAVLERVQSELKKSAAPRERFIELAHEHGIVLDSKELDQAVLGASQERGEAELAQKAGEMSEKELESVSGGLVVNAIIAVLIPLLVPAEDPKRKQST